MTDPDTSPEAVEKLIAEIPGVKDSPQEVWELQERTFATLRALSARVAVSEGVIRALAADNAELQAQLADAREAAQSALARLDASLFTNAEHQQAKDILRAMKGRPAARKAHPMTEPT